MSTEFTIVGVINDASYQRCSLMAQDIARENKKVQVETIPLVETDFKEYLNRETLVNIGNRYVIIFTFDQLFYRI